MDSLENESLAMFGKNESLAMFGKNESLAMFGKNESLAMFGKNESLAMFGKNEMLAMFGKNESLAMFGKNDSIFTNTDTEGWGSVMLAPITSQTNPLIALTMLIMTLSLALNIFILYAVRQGKELKKNVKFVIVNSVCADMFLSVVAGTRFLPLFIAHLSDKNMDIMMCLESVYIIITNYSSINLIFCSIAVAVDRLYSVYNPMRYYTKPYSTGIKLTFVSFTWLLSLVLTLPSLFIDLLSGIYPENNNICYIITLPGAFWYYATAVATIVWVGVVVSVLLYLLVLGLIFKARSKLTDISVSSKDAKLLKNNLSMAVTFLVVQLTYVSCYIPSIVLTLSLLPLVGYFPPVDLYVNLVIMIIYSMNSVLDPIVYILRVPQVRRCFNRVIFDRRVEQNLMDSKAIQSISSIDPR